MELKRCSKCDKIKPLSDFHKDKSKKSGYKSQCKSCLDTEEKREYSRKYRESHKEYYKEKHAEYRARNREKIKEDTRLRRLKNPSETRLYYEKNKTRILQYCREYRNSDHGKQVIKARECSERYKAMKIIKRVKRRGVLKIGDIDITIEKLYTRNNGICALCGGQCDYNDYELRGQQIIVGNKYPSIDHIILISKGGTHTWDNIQLAHKQCNSIKSNK